MKRSKTGRKASSVKRARRPAARLYTVLLEMRQVFTDELTIEACSDAEARRIAKGIVDEDRAASLEFQDLKATTYRLVRVVPRR